MAPDINFPEEGPEDYWFLDALEDHLKINQLKDIFQRPGFFEHAVLYPGAKDMLNVLDERPEFTVFLVTQPMLASKTAHSENVEWVRWNLGLHWEKRLIQTWDRTLIQADILIDDKPDVMGLALPTWERIVYDQPYNRHITQARRIINWKELVVNEATNV